MNEHPSQQWSALLCELEQYENALMNQDGHVALEKFKSAASQLGFDSTFDIPAIQFLYKFHGKNISFINEQEIRAISREMEETIPTNPSALHVGDKAKAKEIQWLMNTTGTKNILAMHLELKKYEDGIHPLSLKPEVANLVEMILSSNIPINGATVLDAFAGIGWMDLPLIRCGAKTVIHVDTQEHNKLAYEELMHKRLEKPFPYIVADVTSLNPEEFRAYGVQGITAHLPWLDNATNSNAFPLTDAFIRFADTVLPDDGWILTTLDFDDIPMVKSVAQTYDFISSQHDNTLILQRQ